MSEFRKNLDQVNLLNTKLKAIGMIIKTMELRNKATYSKVSYWRYYLQNEQNLKQPTDAKINAYSKIDRLAGKIADNCVKIDEYDDHQEALRQQKKAITKQNIWVLFWDTLNFLNREGR